MFNFLKRAEKLTTYAKYSKMESFTHLVEEVGEVGTCLNVEVTGRRQLNESILVECVDVVNCALELFFKSGGTIEEFINMMQVKQDKWEDNLAKGQNNESSEN